MKQVDLATLRSERVTAATDLLLALVVSVLSFPLLVDGDPFRRAVGVVLVLTGLAALAGAAFHGTRYRVKERISVRLWAWTLRLSLTVGCALIVAGALLLPAEAARTFLFLFAVLKLAAGLSLSRGQRGFRLVAVDSGLSLLIFGGVAAWGMGAGWVGERGWWLVGAVGVSVVGGALQGGRVRAGRLIDHNDLFHFAQIIASWLLFQGARI